MDWQHWLGLAFEVSGWVIRLVMIPVVAREHRTNVALGWLGMILFLPWPGLVLYLLIGEFSLRRGVAGHAKVRKEVEALSRLRKDSPQLFEAHVPPERRDLQRLAEHLTMSFNGGLPILSGNHVELIPGTDPIIDRLIEDIDRAEHHVHLLFFIFNGDATGRRVADALLRAAARGVECRVIVDTVGSGHIAKPSFFHTLEEPLKQGGVQVQRALPIRLLRQPFSRFDIRNHRKIVVIDGHIGYTGSINLHDAGFALDGGTWQQMAVRLEGPGVLQLQILFVEDWKFTCDELLDGPEYFPALHGTGEIAVQVMPGGPTYGQDLIQHLLVGAIQDAEDRIVITTPYFVPDDSIELALRIAALRGVRVDLIVPEHSDRRLADLAARAHFGGLLTVGVHIHLHGDGVLHAKSMTVDDNVAIVGSANFDRRSLFINYEANLVIYDEGFTRHVREVQEGYLEKSREVDPDTWNERPRRVHIAEQTVKLLGPLM